MRKKLFFTSAAMTFCLASGIASERANSSEWQLSSPSREGLKPTAVNKLNKYVFKKNDKFKSDVLIVIKNGRIVSETYTNNYKMNQRHMLWSLSKSFSSVIAGVAVKLGFISLDERVYKHYPQLNNHYGRNLTVRHILNMSSGFNWYEEHPQNILLSDSIYGLYSKLGAFSGAQYVLGLEHKYFPGRRFNYASGDPNLLLDYIRRAIGDDHVYDRFIWDELADRIGMKSLVFNKDMSGTFLGSHGAWSTPRDYARIGQLMLNNGNWNGAQILPENWVEFSTTIAPALYQAKSEKSVMRLNREAYGAYWWLNKKLPINKTRPFPDAPSNVYAGMGFRGQTLAILPDQDMVVLRLGSDGRKENHARWRNEPKL